MTKQKLNIQMFAGETGEKETGATVNIEDVLGNSELMEQILKSDVVTKLVQAEADKVRTNATVKQREKESEFARYKSETDAKIAELTAFQKNYFRTETLKKTGLELELWDYVQGDTEEEIKKNAENLKLVIAKKAETKAGTKVVTSTDFEGLTKEQFGKMTYAEKAKLFQENKELFEKLKGE